MYNPLDLGSLPDTPTSHCAPPRCFDLFTVDEVFEALKNVDASKSPKPDEILPFFLKPCSNELAPILCDLFNFFVQKGKVPKAWKWVFCLIIPGLDPVPVTITMAWYPYQYP